NYTTANGTTVNLDGTGATAPHNAARGINSSGGEHEFSGGYGDFKGIDTWTFFPSEAVYSSVIITETTQANVQGTKSVRFLTDVNGDGEVSIGDQVEYTITYSNLSPASSDAINFVIKEDLPAQLSFVSATITNQTTGNNITLNPSYAGSGDLTTLVTGTSASDSSTLRVDDSITIKVVAKIEADNAGNPIVNQGRAEFSTPDNPNSTTGVQLTDADSAGGTSTTPSEGNFFFQTDDDGENTGNDPINTADDDPTGFTVNLKSNLRLVKRITRINNTDILGFVDDPGTEDDNVGNWPTPLNTYLRGAINGGMVKPGDEVEFTIYFLSAGGKDVTNVRICDLIPDSMTFLESAFNGETPRDSGSLAGANLGIALGNDDSSLPTEPTVYLTNVADGDRGQFYLPGTEAPATCNSASGFTLPLSPGNNNQGAVVVNVVTSPTTLPKAVSPGNPTNSYGFIRFRARVN
ncbi:MAG: isopeptide-forming domain-containing fimbrial protein, partial [Chroococcales cyanobacterium]